MIPDVLTPRVMRAMGVFANFPEFTNCDGRMQPAITKQVLWFFVVLGLPTLNILSTAALRMHSAH